MLRLLLLLLLPFQIFGQQQKLDIKGVYETAVREYIKAHPQDVIQTGEKKIVFIKQQDYLKNLADSYDGVSVVFFDEKDAANILATYFPKKANFVLLDVRQMFARTDVNFVYIFPIKYKWNGKKKTLSEPEFSESFCKMDFLTRLENKEVNYYFQKINCNVEN